MKAVEYSPKNQGVVSGASTPSTVSYGYLSPTQSYASPQTLPATSSNPATPTKHGQAIAEVAATPSQTNLQLPRRSHARETLPITPNSLASAAYSRARSSSPTSAVGASSKPETQQKSSATVAVHHPAQGSRSYAQPTHKAAIVAKQNQDRVIKARLQKKPPPWVNADFKHQPEPQGTIPQYSPRAAANKQKASKLPAGSQQRIKKHIADEFDKLQRRLHDLEQKCTEFPLKFSPSKDTASHLDQPAAFTGLPEPSMHSRPVPNTYSASAGTQPPLHMALAGTQTQSHTATLHLPTTPIQSQLAADPATVHHQASLAAHHTQHTSTATPKGDAPSTTQVPTDLAQAYTPTAQAQFSSVQHLGSGTTAVSTAQADTHQWQPIPSMVAPEGMTRFTGKGPIMSALHQVIYAPHLPGRQGITSRERLQAGIADLQAQLFKSWEALRPQLA